MLCLGLFTPLRAADGDGQFTPPEKAEAVAPEAQPAAPESQPASARENEPAAEPVANGAAEAPADKGIFLTLDDCVEIAVQNNLGLKISRLHDRSADIAVRVAWSRYLPTFDASFNHDNSRAVRNSDVGGTNAFSGSITQRSPWGTTLDLSVTETRKYLKRSGATGDLSATITQPLWKGAGLDVGMNEIRTARIRRLISRGSLELDTQNLIFQVRQAHANIIRDTQALAVARQSVRSSKTFLDLTEARERAGQVTKLDVFNALVQLRGRELDVVSGERGVQSDLDRLKQLMDVDLEEDVRIDAPAIDFGEKPEPGIVKELRTDAPSGTVRLVATKDGKVVSETVLFQATRFDEKVVLAEAFENRIDYLNSRRALAIQKLSTLVTKNGLGQQVDLNGGFNRTTAGRGTFERDNGGEVNNWNFGVTYSVPWGKVADRAAYENALLSLHQTEIELKQARTTVQADVRDIMRILREDETAMLIEAERVEQAKRSVEAAQSRFERGLNDSFEVIQAEDRLLSSKNEFIARNLVYVVELARLEVVVGKPTGRVDLSGNSVGGLIDSRLPEDMREKRMPAQQPDAEPRPEDDPKSKIPSYRGDYHPKDVCPVVIDPKAESKPK
jgi:outer membrane protein TolC